jgi:predicted extracellular nuclease
MPESPENLNVTNHPVLSRILTLSALLAGAAQPALAAAPTELFLSEYVEGSSFNKAVEIYNGTGASIDLAAGGYSLELYSNGSATVSQSVALSGSIASGDVFVMAHASADPAILAVADVTNSTVINWNGDDAVVLRKNGAVIDAFGQVGTDPGSQWTGGGQDDTLRRKADVCAGDSNADDAFDASAEWDVFAQNIFDGLGAHSTTCGGAAGGPKINEFSASTTGTDVEYIEIIGLPDTDYSAYTLLEIEGDTTGAGVVDEVISLGTTDSNGLYLAPLAATALENGTITLLLVENFSGAFGADLDTDNDGSFDATPWDAIADAVAVNDGGAGDITYGAPTLGVSYDGLAFAPGGASRIPDGFDTDAATDWVRNDFDLAGIGGFAGSIVLGEAYNTPGAANEAYTPPLIGFCGDPATPIYDVQGAGSASPVAGGTVTIEGVVVGDFQGGAAGTHGNLSGFFVQEEDSDADGDPATSDGIFVFDGSSPAVDVSIGDTVRVAGTVAEFNGLTEIGNIIGVEVCASGGALPTPTELTLPVAAISDLERLEGMHVSLPALVIAEYFNFDRFGEIVLATGRLQQPTAVFDPGSPEAAALADLNARSQITLDDGRTAANPDPAIHPNGSVFDLGNLFRGGDSVENLVGVLDYRFNLYRVQPTQGADYTAVNPRTGAPDDVGGNLRVASFNVLNYFNGDGQGGGFPTSRGASNLDEFIRQRDKIIAAMTAIDADVFGVIEIENDGYGPYSAIQDLVNGLNDATAPGTFDFVDPGVPAIGSDEIAVGLIYKPAAVSLQGGSAILDSSVDPRFLDSYNRPVLAQTFMGSATGGVFTVAVNHLKSKGSECNAVGDPDLGDGAGNCNLTRKAAMEALVDWLAADPTASGDGDFLIIGDLNSYDKEDPIDVLTAAGYTDLLAIYGGEFAYSYLFGAQLGYLDYALASPGLFAQVTGATAWHINADEPDLIDYDTSFKQDAQDAIYAPDPFRSSDHDPVIAGLGLHYDFSGFFPPLANPPKLNKVKAGSSVPVKFSLGGDYGLDVIAAGYPQSREFDCDSGVPAGASATDTAGNSRLAYDAEEEQYVYVWKTEKGWAGSCRQLILMLDDGSYHYANFAFK